MFQSAFMKDGFQLLRKNGVEAGRKRGGLQTGWASPDGPGEDCSTRVVARAAEVTTSGAFEFDFFGGTAVRTC